MDGMLFQDHPSYASSTLELYTIEVKTGVNKKGSMKNNEPVSVVLHGTSNNYYSPGPASPKLPLVATGYLKKLFHSQKTDVFYLVTHNVGFLRGITLDFSGAPQTWFIENIIIKVFGRWYSCNINNWIVQGQQSFDLQYLGDNAAPYPSTSMNTLSPENNMQQIYGNPYGTPQYGHHYDNRFTSRMMQPSNGRTVLGPIVKFRGRDQLAWNLSILLVTDDVHQLGPMKYSTSVDSHASWQQCSPKCIYQFGNSKMWRYDFTVYLLNSAQTVNYQMPDQRSFQIAVPAINQQPNIAFGSCNDRAHPYGMESMADKNATWSYLDRVHNSEAKMHLLVLGGDQIYADSVFEASPDLRIWNAQSTKQKQIINWFTSQTREEAECYYFKMYVQCWSQDKIPLVFGQVPTMMIWDDHDIFDGWGSLDPEMLNCPCYQQLFPIAKKYFFLFQMQGSLDGVISNEISNELGGSTGIARNINGPYTTASILTGNTAILLMDLRSERNMFTHTSGIVLSDASWKSIERWLQSIEGVSRLFLVSSVPVVYPHRNSFDKVLDLMHHNLVDDCRDHWPAMIHKDELSRLLSDLIVFMKSKHCQVTILTGDVHCGGYGTIEYLPERIMIEQYISSGFSAKAPPKLAREMLKLFHQTFRNGDFLLTMGKLPNKEMLLATANFLCMFANPNTGGYTAVWYAKPKQNNLVEPFPPPLTLTQPML